MNSKFVEFDMQEYLQKSFDIDAYFNQSFPGQHDSIYSDKDYENTIFQIFINMIFMAPLDATMSE